MNRHRLVANLGVFSLFTAFFLWSTLPQVSDCRTAPQAAPAYPQSSDGFSSQVAAIVQAYRRGDPPTGQKLIAQFHMPNALDWFSEYLGPEHGAELADRYERLYANFAESFGHTVEDVVTHQGAELVTSVEPGIGQKPDGSSLGPEALSGMISIKAPDLSYCHFRITVNKKESVSWANLFAYEDGAFRFMGFGAWPFWVWKNGMEGREATGGSFSTPPVLISRVSAEYPALASQRQIQGVVVLLLHIDKQGRVKSADVMKGDSLLRQAAIDAAKQWRYRPGTLGGAPAESETEATITFSLRQR